MGCVRRKSLFFKGLWRFLGQGKGWVDPIIGLCLYLVPPSDFSHFSTSYPTIGLRSIWMITIRTVDHPHLILVFIENPRIPRMDYVKQNCRKTRWLDAWFIGSLLLQAFSHVQLNNHNNRLVNTLLPPRWDQDTLPLIFIENPRVAFFGFMGFCHNFFPIFSPLIHRLFAVYGEAQKQHMSLKDEQKQQDWL